MSNRLAAIGLALAMGVAPFAVAQATEVKMFHSWSNDAEIGALNVIRNEFQKRGNTVQEMSVPH